MAGEQTESVSCDNQMTNADLEKKTKQRNDRAKQQMLEKLTQVYIFIYN